MSVGPEEVLGSGGHLPMGLRLGQVKCIVGELSCLSSFFWFLWKSMGAQGVSPCLAGKRWDLLLLFV